MKKPRWREEGFTLVEVLVAAVIAGIVIFALNKTFLYVWYTHQESVDRLRMQRDLKNISYWLRKDLTGFVQTSRNLDIMNDGTTISFLGSDDPRDVIDLNTMLSDDGFDTYYYQRSGNTIIRRVDSDTDASTWEETVRIGLESLDNDVGDTFGWTVRALTTDAQTRTSADYDATPLNFERGDIIRRIEIEMQMVKYHEGVLYRNRPPMVETMTVIGVPSFSRGR